MCFILQSVNFLLIDRCTCIHRHLYRVSLYPESYIEHRGLSGCDCMAVGFTTTYAISAITTDVVLIMLPYKLYIWSCYHIDYISDHVTIYTTYLIILPYILHIWSCYHIYYISDHVTIYTIYLIMLPYILYIWSCYHIGYISDHATIYTTYLIMLPCILHIWSCQPLFNIYYY
jgi:hypothetical protein